MFGLTIKGEGAPLHPNDILGDMSDEFELKQAFAYFDYWSANGQSDESLSNVFYYKEWRESKDSGK